MVSSNFAAFLAVATAVIVTPGADTALTIRNTLLWGRRGGILTALGVVAGQTTWNIATSLGIAALVLASEPIFRLIRLAGAAYLAFLGIAALRTALRRDHRIAAADQAQPGTRPGPGSALRQGLISNLTNPKMVAFFPALLPQFAPASHRIFGALLLLGLIFSVMTLAWLTGYVFVVARAGDFLRRRRVRQALEATTGGVLLALGARMAAEAR